MYASAYSLRVCNCLKSGLIHAHLLHTRCETCCALQMQAQLHKAVQLFRADICKLQMRQTWVDDVMRLSIPQCTLVAVLHLAITGGCAIGA